MGFIFSLLDVGDKLAVQSGLTFERFRASA